MVHTHHVRRTKTFNNDRVRLYHGVAKWELGNRSGGRYGSIPNFLSSLQQKIALEHFSMDGKLANSPCLLFFVHYINYHTAVCVVVRKVLCDWANAKRTKKRKRTSKQSFYYGQSENPKENVNFTPKILRGVCVYFSGYVYDPATADTKPIFNGDTYSDMNREQCALVVYDVCVYIYVLYVFICVYMQIYSKNIFSLLFCINEWSEIGHFATKV